MCNVSILNSSGINENDKNIESTNEKYTPSACLPNTITANIWCACIYSVSFYLFIFFSTTVRSVDWNWNADMLDAMHIGNEWVWKKRNGTGRKYDRKLLCIIKYRCIMVVILAVLALRLGISSLYLRCNKLMRCRATSNETSIDWHRRYYVTILIYSTISRCERELSLSVWLSAPKAGWLADNIRVDAWDRMGPEERYSFVWTHEVNTERWTHIIPFFYSFYNCTFYHIKPLFLRISTPDLMYILIHRVYILCCLCVHSSQHVWQRRYVLSLPLLWWRDRRKFKIAAYTLWTVRQIVKSPKPSKSQVERANGKRGTTTIWI